MQRDQQQNPAGPIGHRAIWRRRLFAVSTIAVASGSTFLSGCAASPPPRAATAPKAVEVHSIQGTWYVVASNLPMWTDGKKVDVTFNYSPTTSDTDEVALHDEVHFLEDGSPDAYVGTDTRDPKDEAHFTWHGSGWLSFVSADWYISQIARDGSWAVISHESTIGTPAGIDIISRTPRLSPAALAEAEAFVARDPVLHGIGGPLAVTHQSENPDTRMGHEERPSRGVASE
jgi:lipocalin